MYSAPCACSLREAYEEFAGLQSTVPGQAFVEVRLPNPSSLLDFIPTPIFQKDAYSLLLHYLHLFNWPLYLQRRLFIAFNIPGSVLAAVDWQEYVADIRQNNGHVAICSLKTVVNAWTTSARMHEQVPRACIFGCGAGDTLMHYLTCPCLHYVVGVALRTPLPLVAPCAVDTLAIHSRNRTRSLQRMFVMFTTYHIYKHYNPSRVGHRAVLDALPHAIMAARKLALFQKRVLCNVAIIL